MSPGRGKPGHHPAERKETMTASERIRAAREAQAPSELAKLVLAVGEVEPVGNVYTEAEWDAMQRERAAIRKSFDAPTQWGEPTEF